MDSLSLQSRLAITPLRSDAEYYELELMLASQRQYWVHNLRENLITLTRVLANNNFIVVHGQKRSQLIAGSRELFNREVLLQCRLKQIPKIIRKMQRFGEPLKSMLDIWGFRIVVPTAGHIDPILTICKGLWHSPTSDDLLLRNGGLQFPALRDYRFHNHSGFSPATSSNYDDAVHLNRRTDFGLCEIQVMSEDLYHRAFRSKTFQESHIKFAIRRSVMPHSERSRSPQR